MNFLNLKIFINPDFSELKEAYIEHVAKHNEKTLNSFSPDSGFDLLQPRQQEFEQINEPIFSLFSDMSSRKHILKNYHSINFEIQCSAKINNQVCYSSFLLLPRSSCSFTPMRLANSIGLIDSGYRGKIQAMIDLQHHPNLAITNEVFILNPFERYFQICSPNLYPIFVEIVDTVEQLGEITERSTGGFGSTNL